jgi:hypothetical protein
MTPVRSGQIGDGQIRSVTVRSVTDGHDPSLLF